MSFFAHDFPNGKKEAKKPSGFGTDAFLGERYAQWSPHSAPSLTQRVNKSISSFFRGLAL